MDSLWSQFSKIRLIQQLQLMQHDNMICIDILLPSILSSGKVIPTKQNKTKHPTNKQTIKHTKPPNPP